MKLMPLAREKLQNGLRAFANRFGLRQSSAALALLPFLFCLSACSKSDNPPNSQATSEQQSSHPVIHPSLSPAPWFEDITTAAGLDFKHDSGTLGTYFMPESAGSGGAFFDFDNDGRLDIYLIHNAPTNSPSRNRLYHQEPDGRFRDVSAGSGLDVVGHGMGVTVGDINNDGLPDLLLTEYGNVRLFLNVSGRTADGPRPQRPTSTLFQDITHSAGIENTRWATAASFFDYDRDGWLDLIIVNYVDYTHTIKCHDTRGALEFCGPQGMQGTASRLFHNLGGRGSTRASSGPREPSAEPRFEDVTVSSGLAKKTGPGLGVLCADFDGDHWPDIFIADDGTPNRLYMNQRNGAFTEEAAQRGIAYNAFGSPVANMGVAFGDVDHDGLFDIFVTHVSWEQHALWKQGPVGLFQDQTAAAGLANLSPRGNGFGTVLADFDLDGALDLAFVNGRIKRDSPDITGPRTVPVRSDLDPFWYPYAQPNQLLENDGTGRFRDISHANPAFCGHAAVARGLACGDIDNDGDLDLLVANTSAPAQLLRNLACGTAAAGSGHWLMVRAIDPALGGRDAYGAEITVSRGRGSTRAVWKRFIQPSYSYLVSNDPRAHFGLGSLNQFDAIEVLWPDGTTETFPGGPANQHLTLRKGVKP